MKLTKISIIAPVLGVFLLLSAVQTPAQTSYVGVKGGIFAGFYGGEDWKDTISEIDGQTGVSAENAFRAGFALSGLVEIGVSRTFSIQPEIGYARRSGGVVTEEDDSDNEQQSLFMYDLIEIPLFLKPHGRIGDHLTLYGLLGPRVSFLFGDVTARGREETDNDTTTTTSERTPDNTVLFGGSVGAGLAGDVNGARILFEALYSRHFNSAFEEVDLLGQNETTKRPILNSIGLWLGVDFPI
ncbi:MAG: porin family protein [Spirochaetota bacterium]